MQREWLHHDKKELKAMLETTEEIAKIYHIKFGKEKSQILTLSSKYPITHMQMGDMKLASTKTYKYLGTIINENSNLTGHIKTIKVHTEAAIQTIFHLAGNANFHHMEMATVWRLIDTCIIPIITYAAETWTIPQKESKQIQQIMDNVLRRIMKTPVTTPTEIIQAETGIMDIESIRAQKQILYYHRIMNTKGNDTLKMLLNTGKNPWKILLYTNKHRSRKATRNEQKTSQKLC